MIPLLGFIPIIILAALSVWLIILGLRAMARDRRRSRTTTITNIKFNVRRK